MNPIVLELLREGMHMKKKLVAFMVTLALAVGMVPGAAFAATSQDGVLEAGKVASLQKATPAADPTCVLLAKDGNLWRCTAAGQPVDMYWDSSSAFSSIKKVYVASDVATYNKSAKYWVNWSSLGPRSYTQTIGNGFQNATTLQFLTGANGLSACKSIGTDAFSSWSKLTTIVGLDKTQVTTFGKNLFSYTSVKTLAVPNTLKSIGTYAFSGNTSLVSITGLNKTKLTTIGSRAFSRCTALKSIALPTTVKSIGTYAFSDCSKLTTVSGLNKTKIAKVSADTFNECVRLTSIALPKTCKTVGDSAFWGCKKLKKVTLGAKTARIDSWAFRNCKALKSIVLPATCKKLGSFAFVNCTGLKKVTMKSKTMVRNVKSSYYMGSTFQNTPLAKKGGSAKIYVPRATLAKYTKNSYSSKWYDFRTKFRAI